jgi:hypothetical protein
VSLCLFDVFADGGHAGCKNNPLTVTSRELKGKWVRTTEKSP